MTKLSGMGAEHSARGEPGMYSEEDLLSAVSAGILSEETARAFRQHVATRHVTAGQDEEHFRLVTGFNDIFVVIACLLVLASVGWIGSAFAPWLGSALVAAAAWGLAESFSRKRLMALPSIVLLLAFTGAVYACAFVLGGPHSSPLVPTALAAIAAGLHWMRFKVPITVAAGTAALLAFIVTGILSLYPKAERQLSLLIFLAGLACFFWAMHWDSRDTARQTRHSDVAFWLHLLAAPLLVHPVFMMLGISEGDTSLARALSVLALYVAVALVSLGIDRRALMVSSLAYVLYSFSALLKQSGVVSLSFAVTALVIGAALLLLSAFWQPSRAFVLKRLPQGLQKYLVPIRP